MVLLDQVLVSGGNFTLGVLLARWLGLSAYGLFSLLWMGVLFTLSMHQAFISQPLMTLFAQKKEEEKKGYFRAVFQIQVGLSLALCLLSMLAFFVLKNAGLGEAWLSWLPLIGGLSALYLIQETLRKIYFAKKEYRLPLLLDGLVYGPLLAAVAALHFNGKLNLENTLLVMLVVYGASSLVGILKSKDSFSHIHKTTIRQTINEHYHFSIWLLGTSVVQWFSGNFFLVAAAGALGTVAVGALRMAQNMVGLCHVFFLAMENIVPAEAAQQFFHHGREKMYAYLRRTTLLGSLPFLLVLGGLSLAAPLLIELLYGAEYVPYTYLVWVYAAHYILVYLGYPLRFALRTMQFTSPIFGAYCLGAGAGLLLAFPMVKTWGLMGAMAGLMGVQVLSLLVYSFFLGQVQNGSKVQRV